MDAFQTLAEVSVAMAGFSSIVVIFKRREDDIWWKSDADRFHGMILHSMLAVLFAFLPFAFANFEIDGVTTFKWCSSLLAVVTGLQTVVISRLESSSSVWIRLQVLFGGAFIALLQAVAGMGVFPKQGLGVYFIGVLWHLVQAGGLFVMLIWIPSSSIRKSTNDA